MEKIKCLMMYEGLEIYCANLSFANGEWVAHNDGYGSGYYNNYCKRYKQELPRGAEPPFAYEPCKECGGKGWRDWASKAEGQTLSDPPKRTLAEAKREIRELIKRTEKKVNRHRGTKNT